MCCSICSSRTFSRISSSATLFRFFPPARAAPWSHARGHLGPAAFVDPDLVLEAEPIALLVHLLVKQERGALKIAIERVQLAAEATLESCYHGFLINLRVDCLQILVCFFFCGAHANVSVLLLGEDTEAFGGCRIIPVLVIVVVPMLVPMSFLFLEESFRDVCDVTFFLFFCRQIFLFTVFNELNHLFLVRHPVSLLLWRELEQRSHSLQLRGEFLDDLRDAPAHEGKAETLVPHSAELHHVEVFDPECAVLRPLELLGCHVGALEVSAVRRRQEEQELGVLRLAAQARRDLLELLLAVGFGDLRRAL